MKAEKDIIELRNPRETHIHANAKSILISRAPLEKGCDYKTAIIRLFEVNNPHKKENVFPTKVFMFSNIEKVRIRKMSVSYYLEGNDIVVNDLRELHINHEEPTKIILTADQENVEHRMADDE